MVWVRAARRPLPVGRVAARRVGSVRDVTVEQQILEAGRRLARAAPDARVILFGSYARGSAGARSDIDILVIEPDVDNEAIESVRLMREVLDLRLPLEVVVVSKRDGDDWCGVHGSLVHTAMTEGRVLVG